jgi:hypothetical protein
MARCAIQIYDPDLITLTAINVGMSLTNTMCRMVDADGVACSGLDPLPFFKPYCGSGLVQGQDEHFIDEGVRFCNVPNCLNKPPKCRSIQMLSSFFQGGWLTTLRMSRQAL